MNILDIVKSAIIYLTEKDRLDRLDYDELLNLAEKRYHKAICRASQQVPFYRRLYKNVNISELRTFEDFEKLPLVDKKDLIRAFPDQSLPQTSKNFTVISTSGTTGEPLSIYVSLPEMVHGLLGYIRGLYEHDINWRKSKIAIIADLRENSAETGYLFRGVLAQRILRFKNILILDTNLEPKRVMKKLDEFKPDFLGGYTGMLSHLALLQERGEGNLNPSAIASTGSPISKEMKKFIEQVFESKVFEVYGATESGPIAFECKYRKMHVNEDLVYIGTLEKERTGNLVVTKLYGDGTPIIRYTGIDDIISLSRSSCRCGREGKVIEKIFGRKGLSVFRKDGKVLTPSVFAEIFSPVIYKLKSDRLRATRIVQHSFDKIEVRVVLSEETKEVEDEEIFEIIKREFKKRMGNDVTIDVKRVRRISKRIPTVISKINKDVLDRVEYL